MDVATIIQAGKVPRDLLPWGKDRLLNATEHKGNAFLFHVCEAGLHLADAAGEGYGGYTVMDDSDMELSKHLNAVRHASGRVLKTGLGMGCFVRMCLTKPEVEHIDVVEIDERIIEHFGRKFEDDPRVTLHHANALHFDVTGLWWDLGWHDIYIDGNDGLTELHCELIEKYLPHCNRQGAWGMPSWARKRSRLI